MSKRALITGASSGIGLELAMIFAREGFNLVLSARREERLMNLKEELENTHSIQVHVFAADLSKSDAPDSLFQFCTNQDLQIDVLINNAGIGDYGFFSEADWDKTATMIDLNIKSLTQLTHLFLPGMIERGTGKIMNVASTASFQPGPLMSVYYATKHYVLAFSEALANEVADYDITVTALCPGPTQSEFQETANMEKSKLMDRFPMPSSADVAQYGFNALQNGKRVAIYGVANKIMASIIKFFPRRWVTAVVRKIQERE
ncbi:SDR family oxidoreductase [Rhodohalobacter sp.]|uniref:SDR family NAD(P)-dependent oxidoreductase n=1 Tax=Rhodohalobacter sp. TaxID=1974210 RepID=UPI002ACDFAF8|nr:SDR family oxidoreductase [Rhodohalobacter sp.]MDZ7757877.1 SDR family oxidoreductase [Rhodohalobacter sp.]